MFGEYCNKFTVRYTSVIYMNLVLFGFWKQLYWSFAPRILFGSQIPQTVAEICLHVYLNQNTYVTLLTLDKGFGRRDNNPLTLFVAAAGGSNETLWAQYGHCTEKQEWGPEPGEGPSGVSGETFGHSALCQEHREMPRSERSAWRRGYSPAEDKFSSEQNLRYSAELFQPSCNASGFF